MVLAEPNPGHAAVDQILGDFQGVIESDCWGAYNKLDVEQQKCLAHFITELKEILYRLGKESEEMDKQIADQEQISSKEEHTVSDSLQILKQHRPRLVSEDDQKRGGEDDPRSD